MAASAATAINLNSPRVPSAAILRDNEGKYYLIVYWLEEVSSVDGIELLLNQANAHVILHEDFSDLEENRKDGEVSIIFAAFWTGLNVEGAWQTIDQTTDVSYIKVRLLKRGSPISDWYPVNCYRVDHLQGTQKIVELKEGSFKVSI